MDLVSNYIGELSAAQFGHKKEGVNSNFDLNDDTFANILEKQMNNSVNKIENNMNQIGNLGTPAGIDIGDFDGISPVFETNKVQDRAGINATENSGFNFFNNLKDFTTSDVITFFPSLFDSKPTLTQTQSNGLFDFERKFAANSYGKYARNIVTDLQEFVTDTIKART